MNGREKGSGLALFLGLLLFTMLLVSAALFYAGHRRNADDSAAAEFLTYGTQAFNLAAKAQTALRGDSAAFDQLQVIQRSLVPAGRVAQAAESTRGVDLASSKRAWNQLNMGLAQLQLNKDAVISSFDASGRAGQLVPELLAGTGNLAAQMGPQMLLGFTPTLRRVEATLQSISGELERRSQAPSGADTYNSLADSTSYLSQVVDALSGEISMIGVPAISGDDALLQLAEIDTGVDQLNEAILAMIDTGEQNTEARRAAAQIEAASQGLFDATASLRNNIQNNEMPFWQAWWLPFAALGTALLSALGFLFSGRKEDSLPSGESVEATVEMADKNQEAILRLLDEMGNLADGDLTVEATVTEDITGAIADSINYAIEALRDLVSTIDGAAESVDSAAQQTQAAANHLAKASENQSRQVSSATESIAEMASSIEQVSGNAERSSEVARHSVEIAHKGGEAVRRTIDGMNTIRETIQDTSKRIKRLGESSQEIGNIVELINDIAEQTNILALNASIQASMAGEAGRGFAVVADEVQRLAERSTNATKQIEVLVKTIQSDTNEAVVSMERSTTDVVSGALLAENAGAALDEIEKVSNQIASLVQNISSMGRQQATAAADVNRNMGVLQEISAQTAENTSATSQSIGKLAEMASQLRRSVDGFTLPKEEELPISDVEDEMLTELASEENEFIDTLIISERNQT